MKSFMLPKLLPIAGAAIEAVEPEQCEEYFRGLLGEGQKIGIAPEMRWVLAMSDDGVTWGRFDRAAERWFFGYDIAPRIAPRLRRETLQEIRIFGAQAELLMWRSDSTLCGRLLRDGLVSAGMVGRELSSPGGLDPLRPSPFEERIIRGDELEPTTIGPDDYSLCLHEFSSVVDRAGARQILPLRVSNEQLRERLVRLQVRHYYQQIEDSGAVRIGATRCVNIGIKGQTS